MKQKKQKKAQVIELANFIVALFIIVLIITITIIVTLTLSKKAPKVTTHENYAASEQAFADQQFLNYRREEITPTLEALLNTKIEVNGKKTSIKDALVEWSREDAKKIINKEYFQENSYGYLVFHEVEGIIDKTLEKAEYPIDRTEEFENAMKKPCYYFRASHVKNNEVMRTIRLGSIIPPLDPAYPLKQENFHLLDREILKDFEEIVLIKAARILLEAPEGSLEIFLYYNKDSCITP